MTRKGKGLERVEKECRNGYSDPPYALCAGRAFQRPEALIIYFDQLGVCHWLLCESRNPKE